MPLLVALAKLSLRSCWHYHNQNRFQWRHQLLWISNPAGQTHCCGDHGYKLCFIHGCGTEMLRPLSGVEKAETQTSGGRDEEGVVKTE